MLFNERNGAKLCTAGYRASIDRSVDTWLGTRSLTRDDAELEDMTPEMLIAEEELYNNLSDDD